MSIYNFNISELQHFVMQPLVLPILRAVNLHVLILKIRRTLFRVFADTDPVTYVRICTYVFVSVVNES